MEAEEFASKLISKLEAGIKTGRLPPVIRLGRGALFLTLLSKLPSVFRDRIFRYHFGLAELEIGKGGKPT
jgi:hypothetical protein